MFNFSTQDAEEILKNLSSQTGAVKFLDSVTGYAKDKDALLWLKRFAQESILLLKSSSSRPQVTIRALGILRERCRRLLSKHNRKQFALAGVGS